MGGDAASAGELPEVAFDGLLGAPPQFSGLGVPDDVAVVVVAVRAELLAEAAAACQGGVAEPSYSIKTRYYNTITEP